MKNAAEQDILARESSKPAIKKMELLSLVLSNMSRKDNQEILLDNGFLYSVKQWLEPYPDDSLPLLDIRTKLLEALDRVCFVSIYASLYHFMYRCLLRNII